MGPQCAWISLRIAAVHSSGMSISIASSGFNSTGDSALVAFLNAIGPAHLNAISFESATHFLLNRLLFKLYRLVEIKNSLFSESSF